MRSGGANRSLYQGLGPVAGGVHLVAVSRQQRTQIVNVLLLVIYDQDAVHGGTSGWGGGGKKHSISDRNVSGLMGFSI